MTIDNFVNIDHSSGKEFSCLTGMRTSNHQYGRHVEIEPYSKYATSHLTRDRVIWDYKTHPKQIWHAAVPECTLGGVFVRWDGIGPWWVPIMNINPDYEVLYNYLDLDSVIGNLTFDIEEDVCDSLAWYSEEHGNADHKYNESLFCHDLMDLHLGLSGRNRIVDESWIVMRQGPFVTAVSHSMMQKDKDTRRELNSLDLFDESPPYQIG